MSKNSNMNARNFVRTLFEIVLYRYDMPDGITCIGEAELTIEEYLQNDPQSNLCTQFRVIRVDILSVFTPEGSDLFLFATEDGSIKKSLEQAALSHYLYPPSEGFSLPKHLSEW